MAASTETGVDESYWAEVRALRLRIADELLESATAAEWDAPSLCEGWRVRDVAGHLVVVPTVRSVQLVAAMPGCRFDLDRVNTHFATRAGRAAPARILTELRAHAGDRRTAKVLDVRNSLFDAIVHAQDIAVPLGRSFAVDPEVTRRGLDRVWSMGWPFHARRRLAGHRLVADDTDWVVGDGPEIVGPALALLLLFTGRRSVARRSLTGAPV